ncbi:MAG: cytochrome c oxidase assembly protein [Alphaproteobacteria bacterium]
MNSQSVTSRPDNRRYVMTAAACSVFVAGMVGMSFAAVPLYDLFCDVTGYGGTTRQADAAPAHTVNRNVRVRFDSNIANGLGWSFRPAVRQVEIKVGEVGRISYIATNRGQKTSTATAAFNVAPAAAGVYFNKIACFCFTEQTLAPGETVDMPVEFFVDPAFADDPELSYITTITLSYTFFPSEPSGDAASVAGVKNDTGDPVL